MAYNFFGVYFEDVQGREYRCGFHDDGNYQPIIETRGTNGWHEISQRLGTGPAGQACAAIRAELPIQIPFPPGQHTQNERKELINQMIYNIYRHMTESSNYGGAHT